MKHMNLFNSIRNIKNTETGKRIFILANGPSINDHDLTFLKEEIVIGMNASTLLEKTYDFISKYYVISDTRFLQHPEKKSFGTDLLSSSTIRILRKELEEFDNKDISNKTYYVKALKRDGFSENLAAGYFFGCTTTMLAIQLAYYLGASEIYLLGCDLRYSHESPRFYKESHPQLEDSFTSVQIWNIVNASEILEKEGRKLINCSPRSFLRPHIEYKEFNSIFENTKKLSFIA
ncbi:6-hydroxymethylpterin diphosphokinase MptE-like protein [Rahnella aquatilis]|uniref:6-hydroxymethylpterin diphosphokinase MptE-like protein n=1 Tax=Rahnella aquatilis TaxID=34038 RepID=UPI00366843C6